MVPGRDWSASNRGGRGFLHGVATATHHCLGLLTNGRQPLLPGWKPSSSRYVEVKAAVRAVPPDRSEAEAFDADVEPAATNTCTPWPCATRLRVTALLAGAHIHAGRPTNI